MKDNLMLLHLLLSAAGRVSPLYQRGEGGFGNCKNHLSMFIKIFHSFILDGSTSAFTFERFFIFLNFASGYICIIYTI